MENLDFTEDEKILLKDVLKRQDDHGIVLDTSFVDFFLYYFEAVLELKEDGFWGGFLANFYIEEKSEMDNFKIIGGFYSVLFFLKKIKSQNLIHECISQQNVDALLHCTRHVFGSLSIQGKESNNEIVFEKNNHKISCSSDYFGVIKTEGYRKVQIPINENDYCFLLNQNWCVVDSSLRIYIENDFKTDEEIRFNKQLEHMKEELNEAKCANEQAKKDAEKQLRLTQEALNETIKANNISSKALDKAKKSNWISTAAVIVSAIGAVVTAIITYKAAHVPTTTDSLQFEQLRQSIESTKSVKVENDTFAINAKVDTVTVKQAVKPVTKKKQNK